jgi:hypothetical protein
MKEKIDELREWASHRCRPASTAPPEHVEAVAERKLEF